MRAVTGNLCRCGAYRNILEAGRLAADAERRAREGRDADVQVERLRAGARRRRAEYQVDRDRRAAAVGRRRRRSVIVGKPHPRVEGAEKVTGRARYASDIRLPGQLYARVLRSPHPHARIRRIDTAQAERCPASTPCSAPPTRRRSPGTRTGSLFDRDRPLRRRRGRGRRRRVATRSPRTRCA